MEKWLSNHGFPLPTNVEGRSSVADLFRTGARCGVYVLMFSDGQAYIGQSTDVVKRYAQHRHVHRDIIAISFREFELDALDGAEQELVKLCEQSGYKLRNIVFSSLPPMESDFDLIMTREEQRRWLTDLAWTDGSGPRVVNEDLRQKHANKFRRFLAYEESSELIQHLRCYFRMGVPAAKRGEVSFWSLSCLPSYGNPDVTLFARLNVHWQEVLTVFRDETTGESQFSLHLAADPIESDSENLKAVSGLEIAEHRYTPGGHDQLNIVVPSRSFQAVIERRAVRCAIRLFNHRLMSKGACNFGRTHCLDLADAVLND